ncbi:MAG: hypothetical protein KC635_10390 [Myxococcales bacterium]|nr:hypothetical protein [Myxococcales bacterium]
MATPTATEILSVLRDLTTGPTRASAEAEPGLAWQLPQLEEYAKSLERLVGRQREDDGGRTLRAQLMYEDAKHDDAHRFIHGVLAAFESRGTSEERAAVARARATLYPGGLSSITVSYEREVAEAAAFTNRLQGDAVRPGMAIVEAAVPQVREAEREAREAVEAMRVKLAKLADLDAKTTLVSPVHELFETRRNAYSALSNFAQNVEFVMKTAGPERAERCARLLHGWKKMNADAQRRAQKSVDGEDDEATMILPAPA